MKKKAAAKKVGKVMGEYKREEEGCKAWRKKEVSATRA